MQKIAIIGYRLFNNNQYGDLITYLPNILTEYGFNVCYVEFIDNYELRDISGLTNKIHSTKPDLIIYTNYRDNQINNFDETCLNSLNKFQQLPLILISGSININKNQEFKAIKMSVPFEVDTLVNEINKLF